MSELARLLRESNSGAPVDAGARAVSDIFEHEPVPLNTFIKDRKFLNLSSINLSEQQIAVVERLERIYFDGWSNETGEWVYDSSKDTYKLLAEGGGANSYWKKEVPMTNTVVLQWGKGSFAPYSPIYDASTGKWPTLRDFLGGQVASAYSADGKVFTAQGTPSFREGFGSMYRVTTKKGFTADVWEGHRFLTWNKRTYPSGNRMESWAASSKYGTTWTRLWDLKVGDSIAVSRTIPEPTSVVPQSDRDIELIGLLLGDGCVSGTYYGMMTVGKDAPVTLQRCVDIYRSFDNTDVSVVVNTSGGSTRIHIKPVEMNTVLYSRAVRLMCENFGLLGSTCYNKKIPDILYSLDNNQIALLLSRLIDTDGWVSFSNTPEIGFCSVSRELAEGVQRLMLRLGALAEIKSKKGACQNCKLNIEGHVSPHISYQVRVRDRRSLQALSSVLNLLDKASQIETVKEWVLSRASNRQKSEHGDLVWDKIQSIEYLGEDEYWTLTVEGPASYIGHYGILHHNSGKDLIGQLSLLRAVYLLLCLKSPQEYFGKPSSDSIHMLNVAAAAPQANRVYFVPLKAMVLGSKWLSQQASVHKGSIEFAKNIEAISGHSDADTQEGLNLLFGVADEVDAFASKETLGRGGASPQNNVEDILEMIKTSSSTRFPHTYKNLIMSFPRYKGSPIQSLTKKYRDLSDKYEREGRRSRYFVSGPLATWDINPTKSKAMYADDYEEDPVLAAAKYECKPSEAINAFFSNQVIIESCFVKTDPYPLRVTGYEHTNNTWNPVYDFSKDFVPIRGALYAMHADLSFNGDRAGIALAHVVKKVEIETWVEGESGEPVSMREFRPLVKVDFCIAYEADKTTKPAREIQIRWARHLAFQMIRMGYNIRQFTFDKFESLDSMQILNARGIDSKRVSTDLTPLPYKTLRDVANEGRLIAPWDNEVLKELFSLNQLGNGKVDHPPAGRKDLSDALVCAVMGAIELGGQEVDTGERAYFGGSLFSSGTSDDSGIDMPFGFQSKMIGWE